MRTNAKLTGLLALILVALVGNLCALGWVLVVKMRRAKDPGATAQPLPTSQLSTADPAEVRLPGIPVERIHWHDAPILTNVGGDDTEDIIGAVSLSTDDGQVVYYVGAFDGATLGRLWRAGPVATLERSDKAPAVLFAAGRVVVAEPGGVHVLDATNGEETSTVHPTDRVLDACVTGADRAHVWVRVADGKNVSIDPTTGDAKPQEAVPAGCAATKPKNDMPTVAGFAPTKIMVDGDVGVAVGVKTPGTAIPTAVGFDAKAKKVRWQHPLALSDDPTVAVPTATRVADLLEGRLYATYRLASQGWRFAVFDGKTGDRGWETAVPDGNAATGSVTVSATRAYLAHASWLDVFEKATGKQIGTIGEHPQR